MAVKVLVVDDEELIVKGIHFSLVQDGMEVDCAYDGEEGLQKVKENRYDVLPEIPSYLCAISVGIKSVGILRGIYIFHNCTRQT